MKKSNRVLFLLFIVLISAIFNSCEKSDNYTSGKLKIKFYNHSTDIFIVVRPSENFQMALFTIRLDHNGQAEKELNIGNYYLDVRSNSVTHPSTGCQI